MKRSFVIATVLATALASSAFASERTHKPRKHDDPPPAPVQSWAGCYVGANVGGGFGLDTGDRSNINVANPAVMAGIGMPTSYNVSDSGAIGGGQIGCNYQNGTFVYGMEADIQASGLQGGSTVITVPGGAFDSTTGTAQQRLDWFGTVRGRFGFTPSNNLLLYGTAGLAYGGVKDSATLVFSPPADGNYAGASNQTRVGWAAGAGAEYAMTANWSLKFEYLFVDLGKNAVQIFDPTRPGQSMTFQFHEQDNIFRVGLNYKFGGAFIP
ncbi:MAG: outer membrane protein [Xanthobacteraceae bacterium]|jgi:outer membrane immunogenic protein